MKRLLFAFTALTFIACNNHTETSSDFDYEIPFEKSGEKKTATYEQTIEYCKAISKASPWIQYEVFGKSAQGRGLPLLIANKNGHFSPGKVRKTSQAVLLIQANIHPGEPDGNDAGMMLLRDIAITKEKESLLDHITILFLPALNVDGLVRFGPYNRINQKGPEKMGWRTNAQNLNLNRDFLKADAPAMQHWLKLFNAWLPEFFIDCHVTDGADYQYVITYGLELHGNMDPALTKWQKEVYLKEVEEEMFDAGYPIFPYVAFRRWHDPRSGLRTWVANPMLSEGYSAIQNRPGLLIETHMLKPFSQRVWATYEMLELSAKILNKEHKTIKKMVLEADKRTASRKFRDEPFAVTYRRTNDSIMVDFLGVEYDIVESELTGGLWFQYYPEKPTTYRIPFFNQMEPGKKVRLPEAYIIPPEWHDVIKRIELHGIEYTRLEKDTHLLVDSYKFSNFRYGGGSYFSQSGPREGRLTVKCDIDTTREKRLFPKGSVIIDMNQRAARVAAHILEPAAPDSYVYWGFFNAMFEQKEYAETYVMEKKARQMLKNNPELKKEFEAFKKENPELGASQWAICNWFYEKSKWKDYKKDVYPVGKIFDRNILEQLQ